MGVLGFIRFYILSSELLFYSLTLLSHYNKTSQGEKSNLEARFIIDLEVLASYEKEQIYDNSITLN